MAIPGVVANGWLVWSHRAEASETRDLPVMMACGAVGSVIGTLALKGLDARVLSAVLAGDHRRCTSSCRSPGPASTSRPG